MRVCLSSELPHRCNYVLMFPSPCSPCRYLFDHANYLMSYLMASGVFRIVSNYYGEDVRRYMQGLPRGQMERVRLASHKPAAQLAAGGATVKRRKTKKRTGSKKAAPAAASAASVAGPATGTPAVAVAV